MASGLTAFPQLRVRTEFSFRQGFGPVPSVATALHGLGCGAAAMVDGGTWGHATWLKRIRFLARLRQKNWHQVVAERSHWSGGSASRT